MASQLTILGRNFQTRLSQVLIPKAIPSQKFLQQPFPSLCGIECIISSDKFRYVNESHFWNLLEYT